MRIDDFHTACVDWDDETLTTEDLKVVASLIFPCDADLRDVCEHIDALDGGM